MAGNNIFNKNDSMEINELAALNEDISDDLIDKLQDKLMNDISSFSNVEGQKSAFDTDDDSTLFEEITNNTDNEEIVKPKIKPAFSDIKLEPNFDDNFIKKYKAKLNKQKLGIEAAQKEENNKNDNIENSISDAVFNSIMLPEAEKGDIEKLSNGKIVEKPATPQQIEYNDSLDFLDGNVKYSKYVIYINPENLEFFESLTVKERKNLINKIIKEQDGIASTRHKIRVMQSIMKHIIVAILTLLISIPVIYFVINASLEISIDNYRRSQSNFQTLYREKGKITQITVPNK